MGIGTIPEYLRKCVSDDNACIQAISDDPNIRVDGIILKRLNQEPDYIGRLQETLENPILININGDYFRDIVAGIVNAREALRIIEQDGGVQTWRELEQRLANAYGAIVRFRDRFLADIAAANPPEPFTSLLNIAPLIKKMQPLVFIIWESIWNDTSFRSDVSNFASLIQWKRESLTSKTSQLSQLLQDPRILSLETLCFTRMTQALELMAESQTLEDWKAVEHKFDAAVDELKDFCEEQASNVFGQGGPIFMAIVDELPQEALERFVAKHRWQFDPSHLVEIGKPKLDETTFSVSLGNREPCRLGNTKRFRLLQVLLASPNKFVPALDIAEGLGGNELDVDSLAVNKWRLCRQLKAHGYSDLAERIKGEPGYYGLFLGG